MVYVRLYGWLSESKGWRERKLEFSGSLRDLLSLIDEEIASMVMKGKLLTAVNHTITKELDRKVEGNDIIAILPIFSGG